jgi:hypothetical protein
LVCRPRTGTPLRDECRCARLFDKTWREHR